MRSEYNDDEELGGDEECNVPDLLMEMTPGDDGQVAATKVGGVPWWPIGVDRPICVDGHAMSFIVQVRIDEIPGFGQAPTLLSFHYCDECSYAGKMAWGWHDRGVQLRYSVRLFSELDAEIDGRGVVAPSRVEPRTVVLEPGVDVLQSLEGRSKLGGTPHWWQEPEYPEDESGEPMQFVGQLGFLDFKNNTWANGGVFLFVSEHNDDEPQEADMILQTT